MHNNTVVERSLSVEGIQRRRMSSIGFVRNRPDVWDYLDTCSYHSFLVTWEMVTKLATFVDLNLRSGWESYDYAIPWRLANQMMLHMKYLKV